MGIDKCIDGKADREADYLKDFEAVQKGELAQSQGVWEHGSGAYNTHGFFLVFGDCAKPNAEEGIRDVLASTLPQADTWPYRFLAEQRLADLDRCQTYFRKHRRGTQVDQQEQVFNGP